MLIEDLEEIILCIYKYSLNFDYLIYYYDYLQNIFKVLDQIFFYLWCNKLGILNLKKYRCYYMLIGIVVRYEFILRNNVFYFC